MSSNTNDRDAFDQDPNIQNAVPPVLALICPFKSGVPQENHSAKIMQRLWSQGTKGDLKEPAVGPSESCGLLTPAMIPNTGPQSAVL